MLREDVADLRDAAVAVVGGHVDEDGHAGGAETLVGDLFIGLAFQLPGALLDGTLDVVAGDAAGARLQQGGAQPGISLRVAATETRGDGDLLEDLAEQLAAAQVGRRLLVLDGAPFAVAGHSRGSSGSARTGRAAFYTALRQGGKSLKNQALRVPSD